MISPPPLGYQSPQHQANSAFLAKWGKRLLILWLALIGCSLALFLLVFLLVGSCAVHTVAEVGRLQDEAEHSSRQGRSKVTSEAELNADRAEIERQLERRSKRPPQGQTSQTLDLDQIRKPALEGLDAVAKGIAEWDGEIANKAGREAMKKHEERKRASYKGFPGHYDANKR